MRAGVGRWNQRTTPRAFVSRAGVGPPFLLHHEYDQMGVGCGVVLDGLTEDALPIVDGAVVGQEGLKEFEVTLCELTDDEREIILKGCLINYNRK